MEGSWRCPDDTQCALRPTLILQPKIGSPLLMLYGEEDGVRLYNPDEDMVYETKNNFSGYRFLANSGKWFLGLDSRSNLCIVDVFSEERIDLPPLESIKGGLYKVERVGDNEFKDDLISRTTLEYSNTAEDLRGLLWVDDEKKNGDYVVVWKFKDSAYLGFCKKGDEHYHEITTRINVPKLLQGQRDIVLKGYNLYILPTRDHIRHLDLSPEDGLVDVSVEHTWFAMWWDEPEMLGTKYRILCHDNIAVTRSGEILLVHNRAYESKEKSIRYRTFHLYKRDPKNQDPKTYDTKLVEVESLDDEALFFDLGITVPADRNLGIEPNSIYFTRDDRFRRRDVPCIDICVYNIATKATKRFPSLSNFKLKDAQWFLPH